MIPSDAKLGIKNIMNLSQIIYYKQDLSQGQDSLPDSALPIT